VVRAYRRPIPTSSISAPIRRTTSASSAPPTRSGCHQDDGRRDDRHAGDADQGAARTDRQRPITGENYAAATQRASRRSEFLKRYSEKAAAAGVDPLGFAWAPFAYGAGQVLAQAVTETKSLDHDKLAEYMHKASFKTVAANFSFGKNGEWSKSRMDWTQVQNAQPNNLDQFRDGKAQPIVWPPRPRPER
jgi:ABC-type branched-subunit amino acid transport system substrate-binding protein